ncbi:MAG: hypothetical protein HY909_27510 [Deltaproteobacteria bacterium]|nr:hypothetical protein [Deltaproteobacteria bacterium]
MHESPSMEELLGCLRKVLTWNHQRAIQPDPQQGEAPRSSAVCWVLCGGYPKTAALELALVPMPTWPAGFLWASRGLPLRLVVAAMLPRTPSTLPLRLLGAGRTLEDALVDLRAMPSGPVADRLRRLREFFLRDRVEKARLRGGTADQETIMVDLTEITELENQTHRRGLQRGLELLVRQFERKLGRPLTEVEHGVLLDRLVVSPARLGDLVLDLDGPALDAWLRDPNAV